MQMEYKDLKELVEKLLDRVFQVPQVLREIKEYGVLRELLVWMLVRV